MSKPHKKKTLKSKLKGENTKLKKHLQSVVTVGNEAIRIAFLWKKLNEDPLFVKWFEENYIVLAADVGGHSLPIPRRKDLFSAEDLDRLKRGEKVEIPMSAKPIEPEQLNLPVEENNEEPKSESGAEGEAQGS